MDTPPDLGPQHPKDPPFTARMRLHQSWYRAHVLGVPYGVGPKPSNKTLYGNMLALADGERGLNFLTPHIFQVVKRRLDKKQHPLDSFQILFDLLSSQVMGFNLFAQLVDDRELAAKLAQALVEDEVKQVTWVWLAYSPEPSSEYLNDRTTFDAFIEYTRPDGEPAFLAVDANLADVPPPKPFSQPRYWEWTRRPESPWPEPAWPHLLEPALNRLWRGHLLAEAILQREGSGYRAGRFLALFHPAHAAYVADVARYQALLAPRGVGFGSLALDRLVSEWTDVVSRPAERKWLARFHKRYLALEESAGL